MKFEDGWYLYKAQHGTYIQHVNSKWKKINCPICDKELNFENYESECCNLVFKIGWGNIRINIPYNAQKNKPYGWSYTEKINKIQIKEWHKQIFTHK